MAYKTIQAPEQYMNDWYSRNPNNMAGWMTPDATQQLDLLTQMQAAGALTGDEFNNMASSLIFSNPKKQAEEEARRKMLEDQMSNLGLAQMYGQMGDTATQKYYGMESLPEEIRKRIPAKREPQMIERLMAMIGQKNIGSGINAWESPANYGYLKSDPEQGDLDYFIRNMLGSQQQLKQGDLTNLRNLYELNENYNNIYNNL